MPNLRPFSAIRYARRSDLEFTKVIAPPYDVLSAGDKERLQADDPHNIVTIDFPHPMQKQLGPDSAYAGAAITLRAWLNSGILIQDHRPAFYPYSQTFAHGERTVHRRGFFALVRLSPFGAGHVVPHEKTYKEAIADRLALMKATQMQLSPIFGLFSDPHNHVNNLLYHNLGKPELSGSIGDVRHDLWSVIDAEVENQVIDFFGNNPIYIADGHHRYTTALQYQADMEAQNGGPLPASHPANFCLFTLVGMQDPGLLILPTHRLIGGLSNFSVETLTAALEPHVEVVESTLGANDLIAFANDDLPKAGPHTFGLFDGASRKLYTLKLKNATILANLEPDHSEAWHKLDVAILQRYLLDEIIQPLFAGGKEPVKAYTPDPSTIAPQVDGERYQIAIILQATPLMALEELAKHNEVMPQKSTYFFPKLATGMVMNSLT